MTAAELPEDFFADIQGIFRKTPVLCICTSRAGMKKREKFDIAKDCFIFTKKSYKYKVIEIKLYPALFKIIFV